MSEQDEGMIPEESAIDQRIVPFMGDDLAAALTSGGDIYISLNGMIAALGLNARGQTQRIQRTPTLARGLRRIPLQTSGGVQRVNCLRVDKIALWMAGIEPSRVKPAFQAKIEAYQEELAPLATKVFMRVMGISTAGSAPTITDPRLVALAEQYDTLIDVALFIREHMVALATMPDQIGALSLQLDQAVTLLESLTQRQDTTELAVDLIDARTQGLTPAHQRDLQEMITRMVESTKRQPSPLRYATIYGRLKHRFRVASYNEIPDPRFDEVMQFLRDELQRATNGELPEQNSLF